MNPALSSVTPPSNATASQATSNTSAINLRSLAPALALLLVAALVAAGAVGWTLLQHEATSKQLNQAQARQADTRNRLARANEDEREIREKIDRYQALLVSGVTTPERRLHWVETLKSIKDNRRLLGLSYEIAPQQPLDPKAVNSGGFDFLTSRMKLDMPLLHEEDLLGLLADLSASVQTLISVRECRIERVMPGTAHGASLKASCEIDWVKLQEKK